MKLLFAARDAKIGGPSTFLARSLRGLSEGAHELHLAAQGGPMRARFESLGVRFHRVWPSPFNRVVLKKLLRAEQFDVVHALNAVVGDDVLAALPGASKLPLVVSVHGKLSEKRANNACLRAASAVVAFDDEAAQSLESFSFLRGTTVHRVPRPVEPRWEPGARPPRGENPTVVVLSRLSKRKSAGAMALLEAAPALKARFPELRIEIVGDGSHAREVVARARSVGPWVQWHGALADPFPVLERAHVVVGTAYVALESLFHEIPVVGAGYTGFGLVTLENLDEAIACNIGDSPRAGLPEIEASWMERDVARALDGEVSSHEIAEIVRGRHDYRVTAARLEAIYRDVAILA